MAGGYSHLTRPDRSLCNGSNVREHLRLTIVRDLLAETFFHSGAPLQHMGTEIDDRLDGIPSCVIQVPIVSEALMQFCA